MTISAPRVSSGPLGLPAKLEAPILIADFFLPVVNVINRRHDPKNPSLAQSAQTRRQHGDPAKISTRLKPALTLSQTEESMFEQWTMGKASNPFVPPQHRRHRVNEPQVRELVDLDPEQNRRRGFRLKTTSGKRRLQVLEGFLSQHNSRKHAETI